MLKTKTMIVTVGTIDINIKKVQLVSKVFGDDSMRRYTVVFSDSYKYEILESVMSRKEFIEIWKKSEQVLELSKKPTIFSIADDDFELSQKMMEKEKSRAIMEFMCEKSSIDIWWSNLSGKSQEAFMGDIEDIIAGTEYEEEG